MNPQFKFGTYALDIALTDVEFTTDTDHPRGAVYYTLKYDQIIYVKYESLDRSQRVIITTNAEYGSNITLNFDMPWPEFLETFKRVMSAHLDGEQFQINDNSKIVEKNI